MVTDDNTNPPEQKAPALTADQLFEKCGDLATTPKILNRFTTDLRVSGLTGEERNAKLLYLAMITRLLPEPVCAVVQGPSSAGKSRLVKNVIQFFPNEDWYALSGMSEAALARWKEPMQHRMLIIYELAGIAGSEGMKLIRTLISEGHIRRLINVPTAEEGWSPKVFQFEGPVGLILTTTKNELHNEDDTRFMSLRVDESAEHNRQVLLGLMSAKSEGTCAVDFEAWTAFHRWIGMGPREVVLPFGGKLGELIARGPGGGSNRMKRDLGRLQSLIKAHAIVHQFSRDRDDSGRLIATRDDYEAVEALMADMLSHAIDASVPKHIREFVDAVRTLTKGTNGGRPQYPNGVSQKVVALLLGVHEATITNRKEFAEPKGYVYNDEPSRGRPSRLMIGEPMPTDEKVLPSPEELFAKTVVPEMVDA